MLASPLATILEGWQVLGIGGIFWGGVIGGGQGNIRKIFEKSK